MVSWTIFFRSTQYKVLSSNGSLLVALPQHPTPHQPDGFIFHFSDIRDTALLSPSSSVRASIRFSSLGGPKTLLLHTTPSFQKLRLEVISSWWITSGWTGFYASSPIWLPHYCYYCCYSSSSSFAYSFVSEYLLFSCHLSSSFKPLF